VSRVAATTASCEERVAHLGRCSRVREVVVVVGGLGRLKRREQASSVSCFPSTGCFLRLLRRPAGSLRRRTTPGSTCAAPRRRGCSTGWSCRRGCRPPPAAPAGCPAGRAAGRLPVHSWRCDETPCTRALRSERQDGVSSLCVCVSLLCDRLAGQTGLHLSVHLGRLRGRGRLRTGRRHTHSSPSAAAPAKGETDRLSTCRGVTRTLSPHTASARESDGPSGWRVQSQ